MKKVIIVGAGGHAKVVRDIVRLNGDELVGVLDDRLYRKSGEVIGTTADIGKLADCYYFVAIGSCAVRAGLMENEALWYTAIHPSAVVDKSVLIGEGSCVMANAVINADAHIGRGVIVNTSATVDHDCNILSYAHIAPGAHLSGTVVIGERTWVGVGAVISNNVKICADCFLGAGAVVVKDIDEKGTYVGVPVKKLR